MKHLILALVIALLSTPAATTAWSQQTTPTEQETKGFIVETLGNCKYVKAAEFEGSNLHLHSHTTGVIRNNSRDINANITLSFNGIVPVQNLKEVSADFFENRVIFKKTGTDHLYFNPNAELKFQCKATNGGCMGKGRSEDRIVACRHETNEVLAKAFNHLIGIYKAENPPLFE